MSQATPPEVGNPVERCATEDVRDAMWDEHQRNLDYFLKHAMALFEQHPDQWLLIHSGGEFVPFDDLVELINLLETFDPVKRGGAIIERQRKGVWVL